MGSFEERESALENKFAHDEQLDFNTEARCCKLFGLWMAEQLGLEGADASTYAAAVVESNLEEAGFADVIRKVRADIEEAHNLVKIDPQRARSMNARLTQVLEEMKASYPYYNPAFRNVGPKGKLVPTVSSYHQDGRQVTITFQPRGAKLVRADLIYTLNGNGRNEEWFRQEAKLAVNNTVIADLPPDTTHYFINLIDENNFLVSYPDVPGGNHFSKTQEKFAKYALPAM